MDAPGRHRLYDKLTANNQRRKREDLLRRLPPSLSQALSGSPCLYSFEIDSTLRRFIPFNRSGVGTSRFLPPHYDYAEVAWEAKMLARLSRLVVPRLAGTGFLLLQAPEAVFLEGQRLYHSASPLFLVELRWAVPLLSQLWPFCTAGLCLVEQDLRAGVLIDNYLGTLPEDPNPRELVYEVAIWPVAADESG